MRDDPRTMPAATADATPDAGTITSVAESALGTRLTRRTFLETAAAIAAAGLMPRALAATPTGAPQPIGLQLYTLRDIADNQLEYALRIASQIGYREVEFAGLFKNDLAKVRKWLDTYSLKAPATHIDLGRLRANLKGVVDEALALGVTYIVCPWVDAAERKDAAGWRRIAADFNRIADSLQRVGLRFAYHNHEFEFARLPGGEIGYDILLDETDPKLVKMELDLYWIAKGGRDPLAYFAKWPGRFPSVHVKDMAGNGTMVNVGQGHIDWMRTFEKRREAGIEHFFVEHDNPKSPIEDVTVSYRYMARLGL
jgi:sugar phosphate isomerase/epimerase